MSELSFGQNGRNPEITDLEEIRGREENVRRLEIAMDDATRMKNSDPFKQFEEKTPDDFFPELLVFLFLAIDQMREIAESAILCNKTEALAITDSLVKSDDERGIKGCHESDLVHGIFQFVMTE
jgi:hypothetical protein